jgi:tetratricopeptide (TPR) repeat protein
LGEDPESPRKPITVPVGRIIAKKGAKAAVELYYQLKKNKPDNYDFREYLLNQLGYGLLDQNKIEDAIEIFKLNVKEYPESWNVYDSLGEAYMTKGDKANAIKNYEMALKLIQGKNDREKRNRDNQLRILKELKGEK